MIDLGAWPGGWLQVAAAAVGPRGRVVAVDLRPLEPLPGAPHAVCLRGDVADPAVRAAIVDAAGGAADVVLSDVAPQLSGVRSRDEARMAALTAAVLDLAGAVLRPGGHLVLKLFTGPETAGTVARLRAHFGRVDRTRPEATRRGSAELYVVALGYTGGLSSE